MDLVTGLQIRLLRLGELLYATLGELQRDAIPKGDEGTPGYDAAARAKGFAAELAQCVSAMQVCVLCAAVTGKAFSFSAALL